MPPELTVEQRADLIPPCCAQCAKDGQVGVTNGTHNGVGVFWVQHGTDSYAVMSGAEALTWLEGKHTAAWLAKYNAALASLNKAHGDPLTAEETALIEKAMAMSVAEIEAQLAPAAAAGVTASTEIEGAPV